jgi:hypothetical protein
VPPSILISRASTKSAGPAHLGAYFHCPSPWPDALVGLEYSRWTGHPVATIGTRQFDDAPIKPQGHMPAPAKRDGESDVIPQPDAPYYEVSAAGAVKHQADGHVRKSLRQLQPRCPNYGTRLGR